MYLSEKYTVNRNGRRTYLTQPNGTYSKDTATLIWERKQQNIKDKMQNIAVQVKEHCTSKDNER